MANSLLPIPRMNNLIRKENNQPLTIAELEVLEKKINDPATPNNDVLYTYLLLMGKTVSNNLRTTLAGVCGLFAAAAINSIVRSYETSADPSSTSRMTPTSAATAAVGGYGVGRLINWALDNRNIGQKQASELQVALCAALYFRGVQVANNLQHPDRDIQTAYRNITRVRSWH